MAYSGCLRKRTLAVLDEKRLRRAIRELGRCLKPITSAYLDL